MKNVHGRMEYKPLGHRLTGGTQCLIGNTDFDLYVIVLLIYLAYSLVV